MGTKVTDLGENNTAAFLEVETGFMIPKDKDTLVNYFFDVKYILKYADEKLNLNHIGQDILIGLLTYMRVNEIDLRDIEDEEEMYKLVEEYLDKMNQAKGEQPNG